MSRGWWLIAGAALASVGDNVAAQSQQAAAGVAAQIQPAATAHFEIWPAAHSNGLVDPETEAFVTKLMAGMTLEEKVGQMITADIGSIRPDDLKTYPIGSIFGGGSSPPLGKPDRSPGPDWSATKRAFEVVAMVPNGTRQLIPLIFGIDAVHGNNNVVGATLFPHNSALGAARDPDLIRRIGAATAEEAAAAGFDWAFGPTLAVPQDDRWGRTYEGYSEDPAVTASYAGAMITGLQGAPGAWGVQHGHVAASAKHFLGDGGTFEGQDQGDARIDEATLLRLHAAGYPPAIEAGTMTVMASYSSWQGAKMHGNASLLIGVLKGRMGFDGFIVGDWNGHGQVPGCTNTDCPATFNAGLDMAMAPDSWKGLYTATVAEAKSGKIPMTRVDDAVRRILRVKIKLGLFDPARPWMDKSGVIGSPAHRMVAREAVAETLVLLKNEGVLPLRASAHVLVAGPGADNIPMQAGGWTLSWQGDGNSNADFPNAQSIYAGIVEAMRAGGGSATLSPDGSFAKRPDAAIVVFGETPYAEMRGDLRTLEFQPGDKQALALVRRLKAQHIPVVSVFLSGRPLWVNPELNASDAFVAAWLPGSEGGGIADVIVGTSAGKPRRDFHGRLSYSWPRTAGQFTLNRGAPGYDPQFALGYGLSYAHPAHVGLAPEISGIAASLANSNIFFAKGHVPAPFSWTTGNQVVRAPIDGPSTQEGAVTLTWPTAQPATIGIHGANLDLTRETNADVVLQFAYRVEQPPAAPVKLGMGSAVLDASGLFGQGTGWRIARISLKCLRDAGMDIAHVDTQFALTSSGPFAVSLAEIHLGTDPAGAVCPK